jgi:hypothetical protein
LRTTRCNGPAGATVRLIYEIRFLQLGTGRAPAKLGVT